MYNFLERKLGKFAIRNLMKYVVILYVTGFFVYYIGASRDVDIYYQYLCFNVDAILDGQVWRVISWLIQPIDTNPFFLIIEVFFYYMIGSTLERFWGSFRFNMFYFSGILFNILAGVGFYMFMYYAFGTGLSYPISLRYINLSMFFAFSVMFSDVSVLLYFIIPIKIKYLAYAYAGFEIYDIIVDYTKYGWRVGVPATILCVISLLNFFIYWFSARKKAGKTFAQAFRQRQFTNAYNNGQRGGQNATVNMGPNGRPKAVITRHKCAVCGRTELDDDELEFRFCSKCDGNYEYCMDHLYTHSHVVRVMKEDVQEVVQDDESEYKKY